jgi:hypothetical protein
MKAPDIAAKLRECAAARVKDDTWREKQAAARRREWADPQTNAMRANQLAKAREALAAKRGMVKDD